MKSNLFKKYSDNGMELIRKVQKKIKELTDIKVIVYVLFMLLIFHVLQLAVRTLFAFWYLDYTFYCYHWIYIVGSLGGPPIFFCLSTLLAAFDFKIRKKAIIILCLLSELLLLGSLIFKAVSRLFLPAIFQIPPGSAFTENMIILLGRVFVELPVLLFLLFIGLKLQNILFDEKNARSILKFKLSHYLDMSKSVYDMNIVKDVNNGKYITVAEQDRYLHFLCDGSSGTGKTSSTILPAIRDDLDAHCQMEDKQREILKEMESRGEIFFASSSNNISINDFYPVLNADDKELGMKAISNKLEEIARQYPVAGITVLAPDDSLTDAVCRLCEARGVVYNRIDPSRCQDGSKKSNSVGMNPFYLRKEMEGEDRNQLIVKKAVIFADVMQAITELRGHSDSYFSGVNRQMIANLAILVMLTIPHLYNRQATPLDLQEVINDFDKLAVPLAKLKELDKGKNQYLFICRYIEYDLLGAGRSKMEDQSRGTRNIINEFLLMPYNREIICSQDSIDFERILANGEITVCNYNLAAGDTNATALGLFFLLNFNNAVLSRPGTDRTRTPHFLYIDELPVLIHPSIEIMFSLFRKYKVAVFVAIQTLDQMEKNEITKFLKGVILGCAHILVFGRSSLTEMEVFSKYAGIMDTMDEEQGTSESSLFDSDTKLSFSKRRRYTQKKKLEEIDIRLKDFQEVTFFTTRHGRPLEVRHGKVEFLKNEDWEKRERKEYRFMDVNNFTAEYSKKMDEENLEVEKVFHEASFHSISTHLVKESMDVNMDDMRKAGKEEACVKNPEKKRDFTELRTSIEIETEELDL